MTSTSIATAIRAQVRRRQELPPPDVRRALRLRAGLSTQDLADAMGVSRGAVSLWELGRRTPRGRYLDAYLEALRALRGSA